MKMTRILTFLCIMTGFWPIHCTATDEGLQVIVSIPPLHALVSGVMQGLEKPKLLVKAGSSPHDYSLKPSEIKQLQNADIIFWVGPELETFLVKPLQNIKTQTQVVEFIKTPKLLLLPVRSTAAFANPHCHGCDHNHGNLIDMHFWLDPNNAMILVEDIAEKLCKIDPLHQKQYIKNSKALIQQLKALDAKLQKKLKSVQSIPFVVFHDAYQYFEHHYNLKAVGSITLHPEIPPSAKRLQQLREAILKTKAVCVFSEPQFQPKLVTSLVQDLHIHTGVLDPLGFETKEGAEGYITLLENLSDALSKCLTKANEH